MLYLYDLHSAVASQVQSLVYGALLLGQFGQGEPERRLRPGLRGGVDDAHLADLAQLLQQRQQRTLDPPAIQVTPQQAAEHQRQHAVEAYRSLKTGGGSGKHGKASLSYKSEGKSH